jgi:uncharacterized protein YndB with AHSA1/START domain/SAM-dependent methyltransferase
MAPQTGFGGMPGRPDFDLTEPAASFTPLAGVAFPAVQDRWERLVTMGTIAAPAGRVWEALAGPEHVREWLGVCHDGWAVRGRESTLDFEDGEFFYCRTRRSTAPTTARPGTLEYLWRWLGIGPATRVTWTLTPADGDTLVTVVEEATNPPADWRSWNGMGWPGIIDQLAAYLRTGRNTRWPWRRMGPYIQVPLPTMPFQAWEALTSPAAIKHWLQRSTGSLAVGDEMTMVMGDASGTVRLNVTKSVDAGQDFPSYLPYLEFELRRPSWTQPLGGRIWIEPAGLGESLLQVFHYDWERLDIRDPVVERALLTNHWINAAARAQMLFAPEHPGGTPHGWSMSATSPNGHSGQQAEPKPEAVMGFAARAGGDLGGAMTSLLVALGGRLGLLGALAAGPATSTELAGRTGLAERYVREWLWSLHSAGYLLLDGPARFTLPPGHAAVLLEGSPFSMAAGYDLLPALAGMLDEVAEGFRTGAGIEPGRYPEAFHAAMERMSATWLDTMLIDQWLPAVDGLVARLEAGAAVADVGCGGGRALLNLAARFPASEFTGYDLHQPNVDRATEAAGREGVAERVRFRNADASTALSSPLDLITMFDVLHDAPDPVALLSAAHDALVPSGGVLLVLESAAAPEPEDNAGPQGQILYGTSTLYCVPTALAGGGPALGTLGLPVTEIESLARKARFTAVEEVPVRNPFNALYVLRP